MDKDAVCGEDVYCILLCYYPFLFCLLLILLLSPHHVSFQYYACMVPVVQGKVKNIGHRMEYKIFKVIKINASILIIIMATNVIINYLLTKV